MDFYSDQREILPHTADDVQYKSVNGTNEFRVLSAWRANECPKVNPYIPFGRGMAP